MICGTLFLRCYCSWKDTNWIMSDALRVCGVCYTDVEEGESFVHCSAPWGKHHYFHTVDCLPQYLTSASQDRDTHEYFAAKRAIRCPSHHEGCVGHMTLELAASGGAEALKAFVVALQDVACTVERRETEARVERDAMKASSESNAGLKMRMVADVRDVLTRALSCPHCHAPFIDFSGCLALSCASCSREFCGVCCKAHSGATASDGHAAVTECLKKLSASQLKTYDFHSTYFISAKGWQSWSERLKVDAILDFLQSLRRDLVWDVYAEVQKALTSEKLLTSESCEELAKKVYSHDVDAVHLVRIPNTFWLLYSTKKMMKFETVVQTVTLSQQERLQVGKLILARVSKCFPSWVAVKNTVPGEQFEAINYPPEFLPLITKVIDEWGRGRYWS